MKVLRWVSVGVVPIATAVLMSAGASASWNGQQLIAHDSSAWYHCTSGNNDSGTHVDHCFYTPNTVTAEAGWWWLGQISESWLDYNSAWISNTGDTIPRNPFSDWYDVYGP